MFSRANKNKDGQNARWMAELEEIRTRWFSFLEKLEQKMEELCTAAIPELKALMAEDDDMYKRGFHKVYAGVEGQLNHIRNKAYDTYDEKVSEVCERIDDEISVMDSMYSVLSDFRNACSNRYHRDFEERYEYWLAQLKATQKVDYEIEYRQILDEYEAIKNKFNCVQCGSPIFIDKIYFTATYLKCPACQTQNTFEPGTLAKGLEGLGRSLAEQRTAHLLQAHYDAQELERKLYHENHKLGLGLMGEKDKKTIEEKKRRMEENEARRQQAVKDAPVLYQKYLRAMFDEWNGIVPDLKEEHERFYRSMLKR